MSKWALRSSTRVSNASFFTLRYLTLSSAHYFVLPHRELNPVVLAHHLAALMMNLFYRLPRRATGLLLVCLRFLVRSALRLARGGTLSRDDTAILNRLPMDIRTVVDRMRLDPHTHPYLCCPVCFAIYDMRPYPGRCLYQETPSSNPCDAALWRTRTIHGRTFHVPVRMYLHQELKNWLARLLSRHGLEEIMDATAERARGASKGVMSDLWDAPVFREIFKDGKPFVHGPQGEGRYVFGLSIDSFNPFQSKEAKQNVSVTGVYMVCLNLPPHLRYLPENVYLVGVIPGPHKPSIDQINHFLKPLADELLVFWESGIFFSRTSKYPTGRLVRCILVPLVCDLPAARQVAGFGAHNARFFCSVCKLRRNNINNLDASTWPPRDCEEHRNDARAWRDKQSVAQRESAFAENSLRWSELLTLPYWDPIKYTVIDSMHNHYLGLLKHHCRRIWGMNVSADDASEKVEGEPERPSEEDLSLGMKFLYSGTNAQLAGCRKNILRYICFSLGISCRKPTKDRLLNLLVEWVLSSQCGFDLSLTCISPSVSKRELYRLTSTGLMRNMPRELLGRRKDVGSQHPRRLRRRLVRYLRLRTRPRIAGVSTLRLCKLCARTGVFRLKATRSIWLTDCS